VVVLQQMTEVAIIAPADEEDDPDKMWQHVNRADLDTSSSPARQAVETGLEADARASDSTAPRSLLPSWLTQFWHSSGTGEPDAKPSDQPDSPSLLESYFLDTQLSRVFRLQEDIVGEGARPDQLLSCLIGQAAVGGNVAASAPFFARLKPVPSPLSNPEGEQEEPLAVLVEAGG
jgi:hypothetical protein